MSSTSISASEPSAGVTSAATSPGYAQATPGCGIVRVARHAVGRASRSTPAGTPGVARSRPGAGSVVERAFATSPLRLLTPGNDGHAAWVFTSSFGGGLVDGDRLSLDVEIGEGAAAFLSTQASTKVYRSEQGTRARLQARVGAGGLLVSLPDPVVCFADSRFDQEQTFDLASNAALVAVDWVTSGRRESGERCSFAHYCSRLVVRVDGRLVMYDTVALRRQDGDLASRLGRFDVLAVAVIVGEAVMAQGHTMLADARGGAVEQRPQHIVVASPLEERQAGTVGAVLRVAGRSVEEVGRTLRESLAFVPALLGDDPWARKW
jgi:urease accessory protein